MSVEGRSTNSLGDMAFDEDKNGFIFDQEQIEIINGFSVTVLTHPLTQS